MPKGTRWDGKASRAGRVPAAGDISLALITFISSQFINVNSSNELFFSSHSSLVVWTMDHTETDMVSGLAMNYEVMNYSSPNIKNTPNIALQNNEVLNKQIFGDADDPVNEIPVSRLEKKDRIDKGPYQPKFDFPRTIIGSKYRSFQIEWYNKYSWLEYSKVFDSAFCFYCRVFCLNDPATKGHIDFAFIKKGFKNWHRANECFRNHEKSKGHQHSVSSWSSYTKDKSVDILLDEQKEVFISK
ncbi:zinc finger MYM-type protein 5-like [Acyrthosiphon pisum]|uniref:TTF-type domain-containing protein n=1 Tax=Acyrthosiphon pisum TaxID=7029 RepID=A0A8R2NJ59_ACYPI|nr:zinc finger MYM-type protein 5-like [Acyrthosiphon pisum]